MALSFATSSPSLSQTAGVGLTDLATRSPMRVFLYKYSSGPEVTAQPLGRCSVLFDEAPSAPLLDASVYGNIAAGNFGASHRVHLQFVGLDGALKGKVILRIPLQVDFGAAVLRDNYVSFNHDSARYAVHFEDEKCRLIFLYRLTLARQAMAEGSIQWCSKVLVQALSSPIPVTASACITHREGERSDVSWDSDSESETEKEHGASRPEDMHSVEAKSFVMEGSEVVFLTRAFTVSSGEVSREITVSADARGEERLPYKVPTRSQRDDMLERRSVIGTSTPSTPTGKLASVRGLKEGVLGMEVGERRLLSVPPNLAFGEETGYLLVDMLLENIVADSRQRQPSTPEIEARKEDVATKSREERRERRASRSTKQVQRMADDDELLIPPPPIPKSALHRLKRESASADADESSDGWDSDEFDSGKRVTDQQAGKLTVEEQRFRDAIALPQQLTKEISSNASTRQEREVASSAEAAIRSVKLSTGDRSGDSSPLFSDEEDSGFEDEEENTSSSISRQLPQEQVQKATCGEEGDKVAVSVVKVGTMQRAMEDMSVSEVCLWLQNIGLGAFESLFRSQGIDGGDLIMLEDDDLVEEPFTMTLDSIKVFRKAVEELNERGFNPTEAAHLTRPRQDITGKTKTAKLRGEGPVVENTILRQEEITTCSGITDGGDGLPSLSGAGQTTSSRSAALSWQTAAGPWLIPRSELSFSQIIGRGSFGDIYKGSYAGEVVAVKVLRNSTNASSHENTGEVRTEREHSLLRELSNEVKVLSECRHPNIIFYWGVCIDTQSAELPREQSSPFVALVMDLCGLGSLRDLLSRTDVNIPWRLRMKMVMGVAQGMRYMHGRNMVHRDLKTPNLLLSGDTSDLTEGVLKDATVKVTDFGLSRLRSDNTNVTSKEVIEGSPQWMAPEQFLPFFAYNDGATSSSALQAPTVDVFAFGVVLWEILTRRIPWQGLQPMDIARAVAIERRTLAHMLTPADLMVLPEALRAPVHKLLSSCFSYEPTTRPTFEAIVNYLQAALALVQ